MSFTGNETINNRISAPTVSVPSTITVPELLNPETTSPHSSLLTEEEVEQMIADVDDAFAMLLSLGEEDQETAKVAVQTVFKMLQNLFANKQDPKFRYEE